jgi:hypothetical protein
MDALAPPPSVIPPLPMVQPLLVVPLLVALPLPLAKVMLGVVVAALGVTILLVIET